MQFMTCMASYSFMVFLLQCLASWFSCHFFGFLKFLAKILAITFGKIRKILQDFSRSWEEIQKNFWTSWHENQEYPRSWQLLLARFARFCKTFQDLGKRSKKIFGLLGMKTKNIQDLGKRTKKIMHQSNARSINIS